MRHRGEKDAACAVDLAWEDKLAVHRLAEEFEEKMAALEAVMSEHAAERAELEAYWHQALRAGMVGAVSHPMSGRRLSTAFTAPVILGCCTPRHGTEPWTEPSFTRRSGTPALHRMA